MSAAIRRAHGVGANEAKMHSGPQQSGTSCGAASSWRTPLPAETDADGANANGMTPLMRAACEGLLDSVQDLLDRGADVNARRDDGFQALALAAFFGRAGVVNLLLERGADVEATDRVRTTAEMWAKARGFERIGDLLREARLKKHLQPSLPMPAVLQEHPHFLRPAKEESREQVVTGQNQPENKDSSESNEAMQPEIALKVTPVNAPLAEKSRERQSAVASVDVLGTKTEIEQSKIKPVIELPPRILRALPEIIDPPALVAPEFHPGAVFVARVTSSWKNLAALILVIVIAGGIGAFAFPRVRRTLTGARDEAFKKAPGLPALSKGSMEQPKQSVADQSLPLPSTPAESKTPADEKAIEDNTANSNSRESTPNFEPVEVQQKTSPGVASEGRPETRSYPKVGDRSSESAGNNHSSLATTMFSSSAAARRQGTISARAMPKQRAVSDPVPKPAPLSVEGSRSRTVLSPVTSSTTENPAGQSPPLGITPSKTKTKVIQWP